MHLGYGLYECLHLGHRSFNWKAQVVPQVAEGNLVPQCQRSGESALVRERRSSRKRLPGTYLAQVMGRSRVLDVPSTGTTLPPTPLSQPHRPGPLERKRELPTAAARPVSGRCSGSTTEPRLRRETRLAPECPEQVWCRACTSIGSCRQRTRWCNPPAARAAAALSNASSELATHVKELVPGARPTPVLRSGWTGGPAGFVSHGVCRTVCTPWTGEAHTTRGDSWEPSEGGCISVPSPNRSPVPGGSQALTP